MNNKIQSAFEPIHATVEMKQRLSVFVHGETSKRERKTHIPLRYAAACFAMLALVVCGVGGYSFYQTPVSYISVDVNPSVELGLNRLDRVVTIGAYNDDGALVLQNLHLKNKPYNEAIELLLSDKTFGSYLAKDALLSFTVVSAKEDALIAGIQQCRGYSQANSQCHGANADTMETAHHSGLSVGKYQAFLELSQYDKTITPEDCHGLSMRELRERISQYTEDVSGKAVPSGNGSGHHGGGQGNGHGYHGGRN